MNKFNRTLLVYIILLSSVSVSTNLQAQQEILLDRVVSVVENKIVLMSDVVLAANAVAAQQQINPNISPSAYQKILESSRESMIEQLLIIEMAEQDSVEILEKDIDKALNQQIDNIIAQTGSKELAEEACKGGGSRTHKTSSRTSGIQKPGREGRLPRLLTRCARVKTRQ